MEPNYEREMPEVGSDLWFSMLESRELDMLECEIFVMWLLDLGLITNGEATHGYKKIRAIATEKITKLMGPKRD